MHVAKLVKSANGIAVLFVLMHAAVNQIADEHRDGYGNWQFQAFDFLLSFLVFNAFVPTDFKV
jgi:hypothetical protein